MRRFVLAAAALAALPVSVAAQDDLAGSEWRPLTLTDAPFPEGVEAFVQFGAEGALTGRGGCNRFSGTYMIDGDRLTIGPVAATRMACPEPAMSAENALFNAFATVRGFAREGAALTLLGEDGAPVATFAQTDRD